MGETPPANGILVKENLRNSAEGVGTRPPRSWNPIDHDHRPRAWGYLTSRESRHDWSWHHSSIHDSICDADAWHGYEGTPDQIEKIMWEVYGILTMHPEVDHPGSPRHLVGGVCGDRTPEGDGVDDLGRPISQSSINQPSINSQTTV